MRGLKIFLSVLIAVVVILSLSWIFLPANYKASLVEILQFSAAISNKSALNAMKDQDLSKAASDLSQGLAVSPNEKALHFNLGLIWQLMKKGEDAEKSYKQVLKSPRKTTDDEFKVEFNLGRMHQEAKEIDKALTHYQAALDLNPDSRETKINIELLIAGGGGGDGKGDNKDKDKKEGEGQGDKPDQPKEYQPNKAPQKPQFKSEELSPSDVNKILGELKQQEQRIRGEYNRKETKEPARGKDW